MSIVKKSKLFCLIGALLLGAIPFVTTGATVYASETEGNSQTSSWNTENENNVGYEAKTIESNNSEEILIIDSDDGPIARKYEKIEDESTGRLKRVNIARWGSWEYTNIAVSTGVLANSINAAFYVGGGAAVSMFGIPGWAIAALLGVTSWTEFGSAPGREVAKNWDKNGNGWVGFYMRKGYDAAGRHVATDYRTK